MNQTKATLSLTPAPPARKPETRLLVGDPAPTFVAPSNVNQAFDFATAAGRYLVLSFFGSSRHPTGSTLIAAFRAAGELFADPEFYFFGVSSEPAADAPGDLRHLPPGMDIFWDATGSIAQAYRLPAEGAFQPITFLMDPAQRIIGIFATNDGALQAGSVLQVLKRLPRLGPPRPAQMQAPVLVVPHVFERELCQRLIEGYRSHGGAESGFMVERDGKTVRTTDPRHKRRSDWIIADRALIETTQERIRRRLVPQIARAFAFTVTRMERYIVACYDESGGYFRPHRDNTTKGTAHRRFAVTINLNAEDYTGGDLMFPEFGRAAYRAPTGGAVVFSCSLMHEALPVLRGQRFAFLPFLYDEAAAAIRQANNAHLGDGVTVYQMAGAGTGPRPALAPQERGHGAKAAKPPNRGRKGKPPRGRR